MSDRRTDPVPTPPPAADSPPPPAVRAPSLLDRVTVVLDEPQDVVNIAAVVRAMKNMGLSRLRLVRPVEVDAYRIEGIAHRSGDVVARAEIFDSLEDAVAGAVWVVGTTARPRTANRNYLRPRDGAARILEKAHTGDVALLFGREDKGLSNRGLDLCHELVIVPTVPDYKSLNLAQAVLVCAYELFLAAGGGEAPLPKGRRTSRPASQEDLESMYAALENGLGRIDFFKARRPSDVMRTLRTVFSRAGLDLRESRLIRAVGFEIGHYLDRTRERRAEERARSGG